MPTLSPRLSWQVTGTGRPKKPGFELNWVNFESKQCARAEGTLNMELGHLTSSSNFPITQLVSR